MYRLVREIIFQNRLQGAWIIHWHSFVCGIVPNYQSNSNVNSASEVRHIFQHKLEHHLQNNLLIISIHNG